MAHPDRAATPRVLDEQVRLAPEEAYEPEFVSRWIGARESRD